MESYSPQFSFFLAYAVGYFFGQLIYGKITKYFRERCKLVVSILICIGTLACLPISCIFLPSFLAFISSMACIGISGFVTRNLHWNLSSNLLYNSKFLYKYFCSICKWGCCIWRSLQYSLKINMFITFCRI